MASRFSITLSHWWHHRSWRRKIYDIVLYGFALAGVAIIGVWLLYLTGITNNRGAIDRNYRYLLSDEERKLSHDSPSPTDSVNYDAWAAQYAKLLALSRYYPHNALSIMQAAQRSNNPMIVDRMITAIEPYTDPSSDYRQLSGELISRLSTVKSSNSDNVIPWMNTTEWYALQPALQRDQAVIEEAGHLTGVEPRMIAACLVGEQIRLFNTRRETVKKYLGPMRSLSVQSQFSYGVNGIKLFTAAQVEQHLRDTSSVFYMGPDYEHLLDFETDDHENERYRRLVDYRNNLYSYIYTGCILHQTMLQWRRAGFEISNRPDILFTLFNVGFSQSEPKANPQCGGSSIRIDDRLYTFGAIGYDFYYSGALIDAFPFWPQRFIDHRATAITSADIERLQDGVSNCRRPDPKADTSSSASTTTTNVAEPTPTTTPSPSSITAPPLLLPLPTTTPIATPQNTTPDTTSGNKNNYTPLIQPHNALIRH